MKKPGPLCSYRNIAENRRILEKYSEMLFHYNEKNLDQPTLIQLNNISDDHICFKFCLQYQAITHFIRRTYKIIQNCNSLSAKTRESKIKAFLYSCDFEFLAGALWPFDNESIIVEPLIKHLHVFDSANYPFKLTFKTENENLSLIYKYGDDLTKDLFILKMIEFLSVILKIEPIKYKVIPFSRVDGIIEYVDNLKKMYKNRKLRSCIHCSSRNEYNFVNTYSFFLTISYIFGVGDRNFDNIIFTKDGSVFFIDYSYILGNDPKCYFEFFIPKEIDNVIDDEIYESILKNIQSNIKIIRNNYDMFSEKISSLIDTKLYTIDKCEILEYTSKKLFLNLDDKKTSYMIENIFLSNIKNFKVTVVSIMNKIGKLLRK